MMNLLKKWLSRARATGCTPCLYGVVFAALGEILGLLGKHLSAKRLNTILLLVFLFLNFLIPLAIFLQEYAAVYSILALALGISLVVLRWALQHLDTLFHFMKRTLPLLIFSSVAVAIIIPLGCRVRESWAVARLPESSAGVPNVILIVLDALRADHLSSLGYERTTSPFLDELARQGVFFERAYSASSWTLPSHASLLTGTTFDKHHIGWHNHQGMRNYPDPVLAEVMRQYGYRTGAFAANIY